MIPRLRFAEISFSFGARPVLADLSLDLAPGSFSALIGPNGAGKTTLLNLAAGTLRPARGRIELDGVSLDRLSPRQRGRRIALVPQLLTTSFDYTVRELVALGRTPYLSPWGGEGPGDRRAIETALATTATDHLAGRSVLAISGGERQRVSLALALAQEPDLLLLDELTANLDVAHQVALLELVRDLNRTTGLTVLATVHDLNLAALFFERLVVLANARLVADGRPREVLTSASIAETFGARVEVVEHPAEEAPLVALLRTCEPTENQEI